MNLASSVFLFAITLAVSSATAQTPEQPDTEQQQATEQLGMTQSEMKRIISEIAEDVEGDTNNLTFYYNNANLTLLSNQAANRMRIISPVVSAKDLNEQQILATLLANYHLSLDARYAIGDGILYAVFIHPLKELSEDQLVSAVRQVATLRNTFGTSYTSGELSFGVQQSQTEEQIDL